VHRPCVPPRDSKRFLAFPDPLALAFSFFIVLSLGFVPVEAMRVRVSRARTPTERCYLRWTFAEKSTLILCMHVCVRIYMCMNALDVSYVALDRMQLNCRYKSMKPWVSYAPQAFQRLSPSYARNRRSYAFRQQALSTIYRCQLSAHSSAARFSRPTFVFYVSDLRKNRRLASPVNRGRIERESADEFLFAI